MYICFVGKVNVHYLSWVVGKSISLKQYESIGPRWGNSIILSQLCVCVCVGDWFPVIAPTAWNYWGKAGENFTMVNLKVLLQGLDEKHGWTANFVVPAVLVKVLG